MVMRSPWREDGGRTVHVSGVGPRYLGGGVTRHVLRLVEAGEKPRKYKIARRGRVLFSLSAARLGDTV